MSGAFKLGASRAGAGAPVSEASLTDLGSARYLLNTAAIRSLADAPTDGIALPVGARIAVLICETQAIRYVNNSNASSFLSATKGIPLATGIQFSYVGELDKLRFIEQVSGAVLNVLYFK